MVSNQRPGRLALSRISPLALLPTMLTFHPACLRASPRGFRKLYNFLGNSQDDERLGKESKDKGAGDMSYPFLSVDPTPNTIEAPRGKIRA